VEQYCECPCEQSFVLRESVDGEENDQGRFAVGWDMG
jgi:hypothetical protein